MTPEPPARRAPADPPNPHPTDPPRRRHRPAARRPLALAIALVFVLVTSLGTLAVQLAQIDVTVESPATGVARVVAQGVAPVEDGEYVWRAVLYTAEPRSTAPTEEWPLGFLVAGEDGPLLLSNDDPATDEEDLTPVARLAPGEVMLVNPGTNQQRASLTDQAVSYVAVEFVPADQAAVVSANGQILLTSDPVPVGAGDRDMDCVSAVLRPDETTVIPDVGQSVVILATDGAIDVIPAGGRRRTLMPGEGGVFSGELEIRANADAARSPGMTNAKRLPLAQAPGGGATFFAGVLGPEIPPAEAIEEPTEVPIRPIATDPPPPPPTEAPTSTPTEPPAPTQPPAPTETPPPAEPTATVAADDPDGDGLPTPVERRLGTDPNNADTDGDRLGDGDEVNYYQTNPLNPDTDGDGLLDGEEVFAYATNPLLADTDVDGCGDGEEIERGYNPLDGQDCSAIR